MCRGRRGMTTWCSVTERSRVIGLRPRQRSHIGFHCETDVAGDRDAECRRVRLGSCPVVAADREADHQVARVRPSDLVWEGAATFPESFPFSVWEGSEAMSRTHSPTSSPTVVRRRWASTLHRLPGGRLRRGRASVGARCGGRRARASRCRRSSLVARLHGRACAGCRRRGAARALAVPSGRRAPATRGLG